MITDFALLGIAVGAGLLMIAGGLASRRASLRAAMAMYDPAVALTDGVGLPSQAGRRHRLVSIGQRLDGLTSTAGHSTRRDQDLAITDRTLEGHAVLLASAMLTGLASPLVFFGLVAATGLKLPLGVLIPVCILGGLIGAAIPTLELRRSATRARERFLRALSCWLELVALAQAGGMGIEGALDAAGRISSDPAFVRIRQSLDRSRHFATTPWQELARLGSEIGIEEIDELAASLGLAGLEGAKIRSSLTAKSASLRRRQMSEAQARANSTTERLFLPSIILMLGFLVFLIYPAGVSLSHVI
jgi:tight adherence protein C